MERKLSGAAGRLRSLKELLSSTISLNHNPGTSSAGSSSIMKHRAKNSVSLFNLKESVSSTGQSASTSRPMSMAAAESYGFRTDDAKSVSMYGLVEAGEKSENEQQLHNGATNSKNPAVRLYYTLRSKFRKRRKDRSKLLDSKSTDFGPYMANHSGDYRGSDRYQLKASQSADNIDNFATPIGYRHECENEEDITAPVVTEHLEDASNAPPEGRQPEPSREPVPAVPKTKCLTKELCDLLHYGWYWGGLSKEEAEEKLKGQPDGAFVVRDSSSDHYLLSLSFNSNGRTLHTRIEYRNAEFRFYSSEADSFPTVAELIEHCIAFSEAGIFCYSKARRADHPSYPVRLTKPVSRFTEVKSLLYLSRFVIRKHVRVDLIPHLPLPPMLIDFIGEQRYI